MILLNSVLVATDFGETSRAALDYGRNLARAFGGRFIFSTSLTPWCRRRRQILSAWSTRSGDRAYRRGEEQSRCVTDGGPTANTCIRCQPFASRALSPRPSLSMRNRLTWM